MKSLLTLCIVSITLLAQSIDAKQIYLKIKHTDQTPLANASVKITDSDYKAISDQQGMVAFDVPVGQYTIDVEASQQIHFHYQIVVSENINYSAANPIEISLKLEPEHKLVINANPLEHTSLDMATPIILLAGDELTSKKAGTLGEILQLEPGLSVSSFGPAVSRPVIRGLSGARVKITNNQMSVMDASTNSADHDVGIEPLLAEQLEVVKGPATLLYGSGAIGGVVNITDRKINGSPVDGLTGGIELRLGDATTGEQAAVVTLDGGNQNWVWHVDGFNSRSDDIQIPEFTESAALREQEESEGDIEHADEEIKGLLENSASQTKGFNLGSTLLFSDSDYVGFSIGQIDKLYGVPGHVEHSEPSSAEQDPFAEPSPEESVKIDMSQTRYDLQTRLENPTLGIETFFAGFSYTDYQHQELEGDEIGTQFTNKAWELRSYAKHAEWQGWLGVVGGQLTQRDFASIGEEAIVPASNTDSWALFWLEEKNFGKLKWELGARYENQTITTDVTSDINNEAVSFSVGAVYSLAKHNKLAFNVSHAARFPSVEELFVNGAHLATRSYEIGNSELSNETSNNFDFSYRFETESVRGEINLFWNDFSDFIYAENVALTDSCASSEAVQTSLDEELLLVCYKQRDATYSGGEIQLEIPLADWSGHQLSLNLFADSVVAKLNNNESLPRIPAAKSGIQINYDYLDWSANLAWIHHNAQTKLGVNELKTSSFELLNIELAYRMPMQDKELFIFLKGRNLLDQDARDHSSFIKDLAPRAGRNLLVGMRYTF